MRPDRRDAPWSRLAIGLVVLTAGVVFWLDQIDRLEAEDYLQWWPLAVIVVGLFHLLDRRIAAAAVWVAVGTFFLLPLLGYESPDIWILIAIWPLLISVAGVTLIVQAVRPRPAGGGPGFRTVAVMAGNVRHVVMPTTGGEAVAVMGGCEIDISRSALIGNEMVIDVLTFWGGVGIRIPRGWKLVNQVAPILGGLEDKTDLAADGAPRVIVRGAAIMAGVEVRNGREIDG
jgi:hypothetical protein